MKPLRLLKTLCINYFIKHDIDKVVFVLCDDIDFLCATSGNTISCIDNFKKYITENIFAFSDVDKATFTDEWEKITDEKKGTGTARVKIICSNGFSANISMVSCIVKGKTKICSLTLYSNAQIQSDNNFMSFMSIVTVGIMISEYDLLKNKIDVQYINPTLKKILGYDINSDTLEKRWMENPFKDIKEKSVENLVKDFLYCIEKRKNFTVTNEVQRKDGSTVLLRVSISFLPVDTDIVKCLAMFIDVTEEKDNSDKLRRMLERFKQILEVSNTIAFDYDCMNDAIEYSTYKKDGRSITNRFTNYLKSDVFTSQIHPEDRKKCLDAVAALSKGSTVKSFELRTTLYSQKFTWNRLTLAGLEDNDGKIRHIIGRVDDIRKEKEQELIYNQIKLQRKSLMRDLISSYCFNLSKGVIEDIYMKNNEFQLAAGTHIDDNIFLTTLASRLPNDMEREKYISMFSPSALLNNYNRSVYENKLEYRIKQPDKSIAWVELHFTTVLNPISNDVMAFGEGRDITLRKNAQLAMTSIACRDYMLITIVNIESGSYQTFKAQDQGNAIRSGESYDDDMISYIAERYINPSKRECFIAEMRLSSVIKTLSTQSCGTYVFDVVFEDGNISKRQFSFFYINDEHTIFVVCDKDVTETVKKQEDYAKRMQDALNSAKASAKAKTTSSPE